MRKHWIAGVAALATVAVAVPVAVAADTQQNTYEVSGAIKGGKGASKKSPKPVGVNFDYKVGEEHGWRSSTIDKYSIKFGGLEVPDNTAFTGCDIKKINDPAGNGAADCPKKSVVGKGFVVNEVGPPSDVTNKDLYCYLTLTLVNGTKKNQLLLYLEGSPKASSDPKKNCVQDTHEAIDAKFVKKSGGVALEFNVSANLLHPAGGALDNGISNVSSTINKLTAKKKGKKIGFLQSNKCAAPYKTDISVDFRQESDGSTKTASKEVSCK
jgi:hypothetical protein